MRTTYSYPARFAYRMPARTAPPTPSRCDSVSQRTPRVGSKSLGPVSRSIIDDQNVLLRDHARQIRDDAREVRVLVVGRNDSQE